MYLKTTDKANHQMQQKKQQQQQHSQTGVQVIRREDDQQAANKRDEENISQSRETLPQQVQPQRKTTSARVLVSANSSSHLLTPNQPSYKVFFIFIIHIYHYIPTQRELNNKPRILTLIIKANL